MEKLVKRDSNYIWVVKRDTEAEKFIRKNLGDLKPGAIAITTEEEFESLEEDVLIMRIR